MNSCDEMNAFSLEFTSKILRDLNSKSSLKVKIKKNLISKISSVI